MATRGLIGFGFQILLRGNLQTMQPGKNAKRWTDLFPVSISNSCGYCWGRHRMREPVKVFLFFLLFPVKNPERLQVAVAVLLQLQHVKTSESHGVCWVWTKHPLASWRNGKVVFTCYYCGFL